MKRAWLLSKLDVSAAELEALRAKLPGVRYSTVHGYATQLDGEQQPFTVLELELPGVYGQDVPADELDELDRSVVRLLTGDESRVVAVGPTLSDVADMVRRASDVAGKDTAEARRVEEHKS
jgi:hypothetical protein